MRRFVGGGGKLLTSSVSGVESVVAYALMYPKLVVDVLRNPYGVTPPAIVMVFGTVSFTTKFLDVILTAI